MKETRASQCYWVEVIKAECLPLARLFLVNFIHIEVISASRGCPCEHYLIEAEYTARELQSAYA